MRKDSTFVQKSDAVWKKNLSVYYIAFLRECRGSRTLDWFLLYVCACVCVSP